jgi:hypothetical protein
MHFPFGKYERATVRANAIHHVVTDHFLPIVVGRQLPVKNLELNSRIGIGGSDEMK